jgi:HD superfamily phosphohydrolase
MKEKLVKLHQNEETRLLNQSRDAEMEKSLKLHRERAMALGKWEHEDASCDMFDHMLAANPEVKKALERNKIDESERNLVKELIKGKLPGKDTVTQTAVVDGVEHAKWFLFEIVANKRNGIDCDKFDYFARDCLNLGVKSNFNHMRYFQNIRILPVDKELQLSIRDKLVFNIYELFHTRWSLHHRVYQHKTTKAIEDMITNAFVLLNDKYNFSEAITNMEEYAKLTDGIFYEIIRSKDQDENTKKAQEIIKRVQ